MKNSTQRQYEKQIKDLEISLEEANALATRYGAALLAIKNVALKALENKQSFVESHPIFEILTRLMK